MHWFNNKVIYSTPDEIDSFGNSSLHGYVIQCLNTHYNHNNFKDIPSSNNNFNNIIYK